VDEVLDVGPLIPLPAGLGRPDVAANLHGRGPQSHRILAACAPRRLLAFGCPSEGIGGPDWRAHEPEVRRWCRMLEESGVPADPERLELAPPASPWATGATVIHPGAASGARRWPADRWAAVARAERRAGRGVLVSGAPGEAALARTVAAGAGLTPATVIAGRTDLLSLAGVLAGAGRVVSGDTGVSHLATALGTPSVTLFGPTDPAVWGPPPDRPWHRVIWKGDGRGDPHAAEPHPALLAIEPDEVIEALAALPDLVAAP
jgi:ADP-heptose:LPS heptosyltransferase